MEVKWYCFYFVLSGNKVDARVFQGRSKYVQVIRGGGGGSGGGRGDGGS